MTYQKASAISFAARKVRGYVWGKRLTKRAMKRYEQPIRWRRAAARV